MRNFDELYWDLIEAEIIVSYGEGAIEVMERDFPQTTWSAPVSLELDDSGNALRWSAGKSMKKVENSRGILDEFAALASGDPQQIVSFARKWGVLEICSHGLPRTHRPMALESLSAIVRRKSTGCELILTGERLNGDEEVSEPLDAWRHLASQVGAILNSAAEIYLDKSVTSSVWDLALGKWPVAEDKTKIKPSPVMLGQALNRIVEIADVRPRFHWQGKRGYEVTLGGGTATGGGLYGAIAVNLLFTVSRSKGLAICSSCGRAYTPGRKPPASKRNYCPSCRESGAPGRDAQRDRYDRNRRAAAIS